MKELFVTGMMRSGTSLTQTLLTNHPELFVAYQPFHNFYVNIKKHYLELNNIHQLLPLDDQVQVSKNQHALFLQWLQTYTFSEAIAKKITHDSTKGKGGSLLDHTLGLDTDNCPLTFAGIRSHLVSCLSNLFPTESPRSFFGTKEILCEEYIPALTHLGVRCIAVIRDPRAVIASASFGNYYKSVGSRYPLLMLIRLWRKSFAYWSENKNNPLIHSIKYEDILDNPVDTLAQITDWLGIASFPEKIMQGPLSDHTGKHWTGNSSFGEKKTIDSKSKNKWETLLTKKEVKFIEACTQPELSSLGYDYHKDLNRNDITTFHENSEGIRKEYLEIYRADTKNLLFELDRWNSAHRGQFTQKFFLRPENFNRVQLP